MKERLKADLLTWIDLGTLNEPEIRERFEERIKKGGLTQAENPVSHFCVYFAIYDPSQEEVFMGHHKKSGLWLFNGGHLDPGEAPEQTLRREFWEELGIKADDLVLGKPKLLTITEIEKNQKIKCQRHYDLWYFLPLKRVAFKPDEVRLEAEFWENDWLNFREARQKVTEANTRLALSLIEKSLQRSC